MNTIDCSPIVFSLATWNLYHQERGAMEIKKAFAQALRQARTRKGLTQEDFSLVSSRTYLSTLERGIKSPTLEKIEAIANKLDIHPVTLLVMSYLQDQESGSLEELLELIAGEVGDLSKDTS